MANRDRPPTQRRAAAACCLLLVVVAAGCSKAGAKSASRVAISPVTNSVSTTTLPPATYPPSTDPPTTDPPTTEPPSTAPPTTAPPVTTPPVTVAKKWVLVAQFAGHGDMESDTFTMTGSPARVTYKASDQFALNIDTGDPADDTAIGSCPANGCTRQGNVVVVPGGWYLHVTAPLAPTLFSVTLEEYR